MDLTPQVINEVEFSMARRGYDPDQVDEFLEKVAVAVGELNDRVAQLHDRVAVAERRAAEADQRASARPERVVEAPAPAATPGGMSAAAEAELETLKRTLLLAQRTADAAVKEAEEEARRLVTEAEHQARSAHEETRRTVIEEIGRLEEARSVLRADVDALERHLDGQRSRLQSAIADLQRILEEPARLQPAAPPPVSPTPVSLAELEASLADEPRVPEEPAASLSPSPAPASAASSSPSPFVVADEADDEAWARFGDIGDDLDAGPATQPVLRLDRVERSDDDDAYLSELRKAMLDDTGAPDATDDLFDDADVGRAARTGRFGRRR